MIKFSWIKGELERLWPNGSWDQGIDFDKNGKLDASERLTDVNKNGILGDRIDWQKYYIDHKPSFQILGGIFKYTAPQHDFRSDNPIHDYIAIVGQNTILNPDISASESLYEEFYQAAQEYKKLYFNDSRPFFDKLGEFSKNPKAKNLSRGMIEILQASIDFEKNPTLFSENKRNEIIAESLIKTGEFLEKLEGKFEEAKQYYLEALRYDSLNHAAYEAIAFLPSTGNEEALTYLTKSIQSKPHSFTYLIRASIYYKMGNLEKALKDIQSGLPLTKDIPLEFDSNYTKYQLHRLAATLYLDMNNPDESIASSNIAIKLQTENPDFTTKNIGQLFYIRANAKTQKNEINGAIADINEALRLDKDATPEILFEYYFYRAMLHGRQLNPLAIEDMNKALGFQQNMYPKSFVKAMVYTALNDWPHALEQINYAFLEMPNFPELYFIRSHIEEKMGKLEASKSDYDKGMSLLPKNIQSLLDSSNFPMLNREIMNFKPKQAKKKR